MIGKDKPSLKSAYIGQTEKQKILVKCPPDPPISPIVQCYYTSNLLLNILDMLETYLSFAQACLEHIRCVLHTSDASCTLQMCLVHFRCVWHSSDMSDTVSSLKYGELILAKLPCFSPDASDTFY